MISVDTQSRIAVLRQKVADNTITLEELKEGVAFLRQDRKTAAAASTAGKARRAKAAIPDADTLMDELKDFLS